MSNNEDRDLDCNIIPDGDANGKLPDTKVHKHKKQKHNDDSVGKKHAHKRPLSDISKSPRETESNPITTSPTRKKRRLSPKSKNDTHNSNDHQTKSKSKTKSNSPEMQIVIETVDERPELQWNEVIWPSASFLLNRSAIQSIEKKLGAKVPISLFGFAPLPKNVFDKTENGALSTVFDDIQLTNAVNDNGNDNDNDSEYLMNHSFGKLFLTEMRAVFLRTQTYNAKYAINKLLNSQFFHQLITYTAKDEAQINVPLCLSQCKLKAIPPFLLLRSLVVESQLAENKPFRQFIMDITDDTTAELYRGKCKEWMECEAFNAWNFVTHSFCDECVALCQGDVLFAPRRDTDNVFYSQKYENLVCVQFQRILDAINRNVNGNLDRKRITMKTEKDLLREHREKGIQGSTPDILLSAAIVIN